MMIISAHKPKFSITQIPISNSANPEMTIFIGDKKRMNNGEFFRPAAKVAKVQPINIPAKTPIHGRKRVNSGQVLRPAKVVKLEAIAAETPIHSKTERKRVNNGEVLRAAKVAKVEAVSAAAETPIHGGMKTERKRGNIGEVSMPVKAAKVEAVNAAAETSNHRSTGRKRVNNGEVLRPVKVAKVEAVNAAAETSNHRKTGRKRVNNGEVLRPVKLPKVEARNTVAETPIHSGRKRERKWINSGEVVRPTKLAKTEVINATAEMPTHSGRKRMNSNEFVQLAKVAKLEANKAAEFPISVGIVVKVEANKAFELPIGISRNTEEALSEDAANKLRRVLKKGVKKSNECRQDTHTADKLAAKKASADNELNEMHTRTSCKAKVTYIDEIKMLCKRLKEDSKNLDEKAQDFMIRYLTIEEIVSLSMELGKGKGSDGDTEEGNFGEKCLMMHHMLDHPETVKKAEFCLLYTTLHYKHFARLALLALDLNQERLMKSEQRDIVPALCRVLPPKLFDHVFSAMFGFHLYGSTLEEQNEGCAFVPNNSNNSSKKAKDPVEENIPKGATVGPDYCEVCRNLS